MPIFFQHQINETTRLGIWKIEENEDFFKSKVPLQRDVTHPHKRLQHLAGRFLLQFLFPDFPYELIRIADTRKPFLPNEQYHFSISHCGIYAAAIVSRNHRVGIDIEIPVEKIVRIREKFLHKEEIIHFPESDIQKLTLFWSAKEAVFKWYGDGGVDFREHIQLQQICEEENTIDCFFVKANQQLAAHYRQFHQLTLVWIVD
ncbi:MAG: 4'-phosphopantetheinyl transferase family protein [Chitinophagaceae bacterium]